MDPCVMVVKERTFDLQLLLEEILKLGINVIHDGFIATEKKNW